MSCDEEHFKVVEWLIDTFPDIQYNIHDEIAFKRACKRGNIYIAQLLKDKYPQIDHHVDNNYCYKKTTNPEILKWLKSECYMPHLKIKSACSYLYN